jgi:non-heme chloroperoxidase
VASPVATQQCITAFGTTDFRQDLTAITLPTLVVHGDADRIVPFGVSGERSASLIAGSRLEVLPGAPHGLTATHGDALNALLLQFLARV